MAQQKYEDEINYLTSLQINIGIGFQQINIPTSTIASKHNGHFIFSGSDFWQSNDGVINPMHNIIKNGSNIHVPDKTKSRNKEQN